MTKIILCLFLSGCASGSVVNPEDLKEPGPIKRYPAPVEDAGVDDSGIKCIEVQSVWGGNCNLKVFECSDGTSRLDGKCFPPDWEPPWKNLPDPPPYN